METSAAGIPGKEKNIMIWADLLIICCFLWGCALGYHRGGRGMLSRVGAMIAALVISSAFKVEVRAILIQCRPVVGFVRETISSRLAFPVSGPLAPVEPTLPLFLTQLYLRHPTLPAGGTVWLDLMYTAVINVICFILGFIAWGLGCYLIASLYLEPRSEPPARWDRWCGLVVGAVGSVLLAIVVVGVITPLLALTVFPPELFRWEHSALFRLGWSAFDWIGIWWN